MAAALVVSGALAYRFVRSVRSDAGYVVGACLDAIPLDDGPMESDPAVVDCDSAAAKSQIIAIHPDTPASAASGVCPQEWVAALERSGDLLCLIDA